MAKFKSYYYSQRGIGKALTEVNSGLIGQVFYAKKTADADYKDFVVLKPVGSVKTTVQAALDACTASQGDVVVVCPGTWTEALTMTKADVTIIGAGATPHSTVLHGGGSIAITVTGVDVRIENLHLYNTGAAIVCVYGTGLVGAPSIINCDFTQIELTSTACISLAGVTSRGLRVVGCNFLGASGSADAINAAGKQAYVEGNTAEDLNTTEGTCFGVTSYGTGSSNLAV